MAMLRPRKSESKDDFISRFMENEKMVDEYPDNKKRASVAYDTYRKNKGKKKIKKNSAGTVSVIKSNIGSDVRYDTLEGREHLVAPCIMINEGVHQGNAGRVYYPGEELEMSSPAWNNKPVVRYHPKQNGHSVAASNASVLDEFKVGVVLNSEYVDDGDKLRSELWIDVLRANEVDDTLIPMITSGDIMEVSTGLFTDDVVENGKYEDEDFDIIAFNYRPDHLALLPDKEGACSVADGAGFPRLNESGAPTRNELSSNDKYDAIRKALGDKKKSYGVNWPWLTDIFNKYFVFSAYDPEAEVDKHYKVGYSVKNDIVSLDDTITEVQKITKYKVKENERTNQMTKKEIIDTLVSNAQYKWNEEDRQGLDGMNEDILAKMLVNEQPKPDVKPVEAPVAKAEAPVVNETVPPKSMEEAIASVPEEFRGVLNESIVVFKKQKDDAVGKLVANKRCKFTKEQLDVKSMDELVILNEMIEVTPDYSGMGAPDPLPTENASAGQSDALPLPDVFAEA